jgi:hypothetical protein
MDQNKIDKIEDLEWELSVAEEEVAGLKEEIGILHETLDDAEEEKARITFVLMALKTTDTDMMQKIEEQRVIEEKKVVAALERVKEERALSRLTVYQLFCKCERKARRGEGSIKEVLITFLTGHAPH